MRLGLIFGFVLLTWFGNTASAQQSCAIAGAAYASGASLCLSAARDGRIEQMLFTCDNGAWTNQDLICPEEYSYFCKVGPHAVAVGQRLLLGAGPAFLECKFPGVFQLNQESAPTTTAWTASKIVRRVQLYLSNEGELDCPADACTGQTDEKTLTAVARYISENFSTLTDEDRAAFGVGSAAEVEAVVLAQSPIDIIPLFVRIFDVPLTE